MNARYSFCASYRTTFNQVMQHAQHLVFIQYHLANGLVVWLNESLFAGEALKPLMTFAVFSGFLSWRVAGWTIHLVCSFLATQE
jgi:hypothetical protein